MLDRAEFSTGNIVSFWNGKTFFKATIHDLVLNPMTNEVEYVIFYRENNTSHGHFRARIKAHQIKQSIHFKGAKE